MQQDYCPVPMNPFSAGFRQHSPDFHLMCPFFLHRFPGCDPDHCVPTPLTGLLPEPVHPMTSDYLALSDRLPSSDRLMLSEHLASPDHLMLSGRLTSTGRPSDPHWKSRQLRLK